MRLIPSDPDVETMISRIKRGDIKLQPDFQRGEVWSDVKKRRLIDSILRSWHVPPIHVVEVKDGPPEVLDGQQRLVAIRDFAVGRITVDGSIEPKHEGIAQLDGMRYEELPPDWRRRFNGFSIRVFNIVDYSADEPAELFFRLNQPVALTSPEQRNAFFGAARTQVKDLAAILAQNGVGAEFLGFSNSRMAYEDVIARFCSHLEVGTLKAKVTAGTLADRYRAKSGFGDSVYDKAREALAIFALAAPTVVTSVRFNKATLFSWLWFTATARSDEGPKGLDPETLGRFISFFEGHRLDRRARTELTRALPDEAQLPAVRLRGAFEIYDDRSSSRVLDISSLLARASVIWIVGVAFEDEMNVRLVPEGAATRSAQLRAQGELAALGEEVVGSTWSNS